MLQKKTIAKRPLVSRPLNSSSGGGLNIQQSEGKISIYKTACVYRSSRCGEINVV